MARHELFIPLFGAIILFFVTLPITLGQAVQRTNQEQLEETLERLEDNTDEFRESVEDALDDSRIEGTSAEDRINEFIEEFEKATDRLQDKFGDDDAAEVEAEVVMREAVKIEAFLRRHSMGSEVEGRWDEVRRNLRSLASAYGVRWTLDGRLTTPTRLSKDEMEDLLEEVEEKAGNFRSHFDDALDRSRIDDTDAEEQIKRFVEEFENASERLRDRFDDDEAAASDVREVLERAAYIDRFMNRHNHESELQSQWLDLRRDLDRLSAEYGVNWNW